MPLNLTSTQTYKRNFVDRAVFAGQCILCLSDLYGQEVLNKTLQHHLTRLVVQYTQGNSLTRFEATRKMKKCERVLEIMLKLTSKKDITASGCAEQVKNSLGALHIDSLHAGSDKVSAKQMKLFDAAVRNSPWDDVAKKYEATKIEFFSSKHNTYNDLSEYMTQTYTSHEGRATVFMNKLELSGVDLSTCSVNDVCALQLKEMHAAFKEEQQHEYQEQEHKSFEDRFRESNSGLGF